MASIFGVRRDRDGEGKATTRAVRDGGGERVVSAMEAHARIEYSRRVPADDESAGGVPEDSVDDHSSDCSGGEPGGDGDGYGGREEHGIYVAGMVQQGWGERGGGPIDCIASGYDDPMSRDEDPMPRMESGFHSPRSTIGIRHARVSDQRRFPDIYQPVASHTAIGSDYYRRMSRDIE